MRKKLFFILLLNSVFLFSQSNFSRGFKDGYEKGFCQDKGIGCLAPISPISPIPQIGESLDNYQDGYNRGFKTGLQDQNKENSNSSSSTDSRRRYETAKSEFVDDFIYNPYKNADFVNLQVKVISQLIDNAVESNRNGDYDESIEYANKVLKLQPNIAVAYLIKSSSYYQKGQIIDAYNTGEKAYLISKNNKDWYEKLYKELSSYYSDLMQTSQFTTVQKVSENIWNKNNLTNYFLGLSLYYQNDLKGAKKAFKKVTNFDAAKQYLAAIESNQQVPNPYSAESKNKMSANKLYKEVYELFQAEKYNDIIVALDGKMNNIPNDMHSSLLSLYQIRGLSYYNIADYEKSINDLNSAYSLTSDDEIKASILLYRGSAFLMTGKKLIGCDDLKKSYQLGNQEANSQIQQHCK